VAVPAQLRSLVAPQAWRFALALAALAAVAALFGWTAVAWTLVALAAANVAFFRNPRRAPPGDERQVVSPADGRVVVVERLESPDPFVGAGWRITIFLSVFNVHINRAPLSGKVRGVARKGSSFKAAFRGDASELNVQSRIDLEGSGGVRIAFSQITGLIARRIVCYAGEGDELVRGEPYGLICYGSRMDVFLPSSAEPRVARGDRVRGGLSVLGEITRDA